MTEPSLSSSPRVVRLHAAAGALALLCIASFWTSTVVSELFLDTGAIVAVKRAILLAMAVLVPALSATGATGFRLERGRGGALVHVKRRRMPVVAANGLLVLLPSAVFLHHKATAGELAALFMAVQALELAAGAVNLVLLGLNARDGLRLSGRLRGRPRSARA
jgi:hypothetical protein